MTRRYLDRKTKEQHKRLARFDDDLKYVTEKGPKIPEFDDAVRATRMVYLKDVEVEPIDADDILTMKIMELVNAAKETRQYVEQANMHLDEQNLKIGELKKMQKTFEAQVKSFEVD